MYMGFHVIIDFICLVVILDQRNCVVYIIQLDLTYDRVALFQFVVENHRNTQIVQETFHKLRRRITANIYHQLVKHVYNVRVVT